MNDRIKRARELIDRVYKWNEAGGNLHFMLQDGNLEDHWFDKPPLPILIPLPNPGQLATEEECFNYLKSLTYEERCEACGFVPDYEDSDL